MKSQITSKQAILISGGAGFIGSNFVNYFHAKYPEYQIINIDRLTYAGNLNNLKYIINDKRHHFVQGDISNDGLVNYLFKEFDVMGVIHFAAESHVDNSISGPGIFFETNVLGTYVLLENARQYWMEKPGKYKPDYTNCRFHHISTDEVYGTLGATGAFTEETSYAPNSPYSASKAGSDFAVRSYHHTYGLNTVITNCSNNYGPVQHDEKLIPTIIRNALKLSPIPIYGEGKNVRDWLYVIDHCTGIDLAFHNGKSGETYNIGGRNERENIYIARTICDILDIKKPRSDKHSYHDLITYVTDRPGHDFRYAIDASKIENELGWKAAENFESGIEKTVQWYLEKYKNTFEVL